MSHKSKSESTDKASEASKLAKESEGEEEAEQDTGAAGEDSDAQNSEEQQTTATTTSSAATATATESTGKKKKKKSKSTKPKNAATEGSSADGALGSGLTSEQLQQLVATNPALKAQVTGMDDVKIRELMNSLQIDDLLAGSAAGEKTQKDMGAHKFWQTQPVTSFDEAKNQNIEDGPIKQIDIERVRKEPSPMYEGFEWVTMDLTDDKELQEVYDLLSNHYVEDGEAMFRFNYSSSFLNWALKAPGWRKEWHVGVRVTKTQKLVAFISGIPMSLRVRKANINTSEVNFLCVHKKLRDKRLAPVLIQEITRRCYLVGTFQAIYTGGVLLPTPVSTCRYFHRSLDWEKLYDLKFSPLPSGSTPQRQIAKFKLPEKTATEGLRPMKLGDAENVVDLLNRYLNRFDMAQTFSLEEVKHWLLPDDKTCSEQVVWAYVVEDPSTKKMTDFFSFYRLASTAIGSTKHTHVNAAYLYYYATETCFPPSNDNTKLKARLNLLMKDALILAKKAKFDVFNALTLLDNPLFLENLLFGAGDGQLHYYLYNYRAAAVPGGVDENNRVCEKAMGGVGVVML